MKKQEDKCNQLHNQEKEDDDFNEKKSKRKERNECSAKKIAVKKCVIGEEQCLLELVKILYHVNGGKIVKILHLGEDVCNRNLTKL